VECMEREIDAVREAGLAGVVFGASLPPNDCLDTKVLTRLMRRSQGMGTTLHRAFDLVPNLADAVTVASELGFERILTSGRAVRAIDGIDDLVEAFRLAAANSNNIQIMPGSGLCPETLPALLARIHDAAAEGVVVHEIHSSCSSSSSSTTADQDQGDQKTEEAEAGVVAGAGAPSSAGASRLGFETAATRRRTNLAVVRKMKELCMMYNVQHTNDHL